GKAFRNKVKEMLETVEDLKKLQPVVMKQLQILFEKNRIAHAYIFDGEKGTGKKEIMKFFVKLMLCQNPSKNVPCEICRNCKRIESGNQPILLQVEPDSQFIKVDQIPDLISIMTKTSIEEGRKIYVIHQADRLNNSAA